MKATTAVAWLAGSVLTLASAIAVQYLTGLGETFLRRWLPWLLRRDAPTYDSRGDELFPITVWSARRHLDESRLKTTFLSKAQRPALTLIDASVLDRAQDRTTNTGDTAYLTHISVDHRESAATQICRVSIAPSHYSEVRAIEHLRENDPRSLAAADRAVAENARTYLECAVPSSLAVNIVLVGKGNLLFCAERSAAVDNAVGCWTVGVFETLKQADTNRPGGEEDLFALVRRGLAEEVGLSPADYGPVHLTWLGIYRPILRGHLVALVKARRKNQEILELARRSHSSHEHATFTWMPLNRRLVTRFTNAPRDASSGSVGAVIRAGGKRWLEQSRLSVTEAWRCLDMLSGD